MILYCSFTAFSVYYTSFITIIIYYHIIISIIIPPGKQKLCRSYDERAGDKYGRSLVGRLRATSEWMERSSLQSAVCLSTVRAQQWPAQPRLA